MKFLISNMRVLCEKPKSPDLEIVGKKDFFLRGGGGQNLKFLEISLFQHLFAINLNGVKMLANIKKNS